ncbi:TGF-beta-activated kinase 1 and MAP3K7-binding protein 1-like [Ruditapes philippinarum]|uniref:TGF-beta-activated kinase 1 and MAP3K7-binding protein 1-like n=1 Tax=Ruditapes philippinarum TaxID=129788 RepID=UPI00295A5A44|nr:TGF-beta-activated kinase 1 and MAP3K7-binding protein 1-like [Ruditapes philippinarum]
MSKGRVANGSVNTPNRLDLQAEPTPCWTDDLPVCHHSGVGFSTNQIYREDGNRREEHEFEDKNFHFSQDGVCLYGVFDGHDGSRASNFAAQRMPAELLLGQLSGKTTDEEIKEVLYQAFVEVEKSFFESIDEQLVARTTLQLQLPEGISYHEACQQYPDIISKLHALDKEISGGTTGTVVLIYNNKLYVANVGDTRALLVQTDAGGIMSVRQLTVDHTIDSEQEQVRLRTLGLDVDKLFQLRKIGTSDCTRCIGDFHTKGGYKDIDILSQAVREPVIAEPHVSDGYPIDSCSSFLLIMSDGLYHALQDATETARVNTEVAQMVAVEFNVQSTLNGVAQACVDKVVRIHHDSFMMGTPDVKARCHKRGDITLLVRNFNYILPNAIGTPTGGSRFLPVSVPYYPSTRPAVPPSISIPDSTPLTFGNEGIQDEATTPVASDPSPSRSPGESSLLDTNREQTRDSQASTETYSTTNSTQSSEETRFPSRFYKREKLILDENGRVEAYVDFSDFYRAIEAMTESQRETLNNETKPKSGYETIVEEPTGAASSPTVASQPLPGTSTDT